MVATNMATIDRPTRADVDHEQLREEFAAYLGRNLGRGLSAEQMRAIMQAEAQRTLIGRVDAELIKVAHWHPLKP